MRLLAQRSWKIWLCTLVCLWWLLPMMAQGYQVPSVSKVAIGRWQAMRSHSSKIDSRSYHEVLAGLRAALVPKGEEGSDVATVDTQLVEVHLSLGEVYASIGRAGSSVRSYAQALNLLDQRSCSSHADSVLAAELLLRQAEQYGQLSEKVMALDLAVQAVTVLRRVLDAPDSNYAKISGRAADLLANLRLLVPAERVLREALEFQLTAVGDSASSDHAAATMARLGEVLVRREMPDSAMVYLSGVSSLLPRCSARTQERVALARARCHAALRQWSQAQAQFGIASSLAKADSLDPQHRLASVLEAQGLALASQGRHTEALQAYQFAFMEWLPGFRDSLVQHNPQNEFWDDNPIIYRLLLAKARSFEALGQAHRSLQCRDAAFDFIDRLRRLALLRHAPQFATAYTQSDYASAIALAYEEYKANNDDPIYLSMLLEFMERRQTNALLQSVWEMDQWSPGLGDSLYIERHVWQGKMLAQRRVGHVSAVADARYLALQDTIARLMPGLRELTRPLRLATPLSVASRLADKEAFLEIFVGERAAYLLAVDRQRSACMRVPLTEDYRTAVDSLAAMLRRPPDAKRAELDYVHYQNWAYLVFGTWVRPLVAGYGGHVGYKVVTVVPDSREPFIPLEALIAYKGGSTHFLTAAYLKRWQRFRYCAAATLDEGGKVHAPEMQTLLALAPSEQEPDLLLEAKAAYGTYNKSRLLQSSRASEASLRELAPNYRLLHFSCPCQANDQQPMRSYLSLQRRSGAVDSLYAFELAGLGMHAELASVAACVSGEGRSPAAGTWMGISQAFQAGGCPRMLAHLWDVGDANGVPILSHFYNRLRAGHPATRALHEAQLRHLGSEEVEEQALLAHPYFWANLVVIGSDGPRLGQGPTEWTPLLVWGSIIALVIALLQRRRRNRKRLMKKLRAMGKA